MDFRDAPFSNKATWHDAKHSQVAVANTATKEYFHFYKGPNQAAGVIRQ
jgi:hypothetical protein